MSTETLDVTTYADAVDEALPVVLNVLHVENASSVDVFTPGLTLLQVDTGAATDAIFADAYAVQGSVAVATDSVQGVSVTTFRADRAWAADSAWVMVSEFGVSSAVGTDAATVSSDALGTSYGVASDAISASATATVLGVSSGEVVDSPYIVATVDFTNDGVVTGFALALSIEPNLFADAAHYTESYSPSSTTNAPTFLDAAVASDAYDVHIETTELFVDHAYARSTDIQTVSPRTP